MTPRHESSLATESRALLARLGGRPWVEDFYLAGSAALALYTGHRPVRDLDLMSNANRLTPPERRDLLGDLQALDPAAEVETARDGYLFVRLGAKAFAPGSDQNAKATAPGSDQNAKAFGPGSDQTANAFAPGRNTGVGLRLFYYPYPLVDPFAEVAGVAVVSAVDLGLMKVAAIISRGTRRDFVDLYLLCRTLPLPALLARAEDKFGHVRDFPLQALKGLADTSLVEGEPMPSLATPLAWEEVEGWLREQIKELGRERVGLA